MKQDKKKRIMKFLKTQKGLVATGRIASNIQSDQWLAEKYLGILEGEGLIKKTVTPNAVYWEIKDSHSIKMEEKNDNKNSRANR